MKAPIFTLCVLALCSNCLTTSTPQTAENLGDNEADDDTTGSWQSSGDNPDETLDRTLDDGKQAKRKDKQDRGRKGNFRTYVVRKTDQCKNWKPIVNVTVDQRRKSLGINLCDLSNPGKLPLTYISLFHYEKEKRYPFKRISTDKCLNKFENLTKGCYDFELRIYCPKCFEKKYLSQPCEFFKGKSGRYCLLGEVIKNITVASSIPKTDEGTVTEDWKLWTAVISLVIVIVLILLVMGVLKICKQHKKCKDPSSNPVENTGQDIFQSPRSESASLLHSNSTGITKTFSCITIATEPAYTEDKEEDTEYCHEISIQSDPRNKFEAETILQNPCGSNRQNSFKDTKSYDSLPQLENEEGRKSLGPGILHPNQEQVVHNENNKNRPRIPIPYALLGLRPPDHHQRLHLRDVNYSDSRTDADIRTTEL